jgi:repressor LexA
VEHTKDFVMLTAQMQKLLLFIHDRVSKGGVSPSFEEMKIALNLKSKSGIHRLIEALEERGYIERLANRARALEIKKMPEGLETPAINNAPRIMDSKPLTQTLSDMVSIPLLGKIAAGTPIEAIEQQGDMVDLPQSMIGRQGEHFALTVEGDSMIKAGINDGDTVIIRKTDRAQDGKIIVALVDELEVTLKRLYRQNGKIILQPENDEHKPRILNPDRVRIQGELASLLRTYH